MKKRRSIMKRRILARLKANEYLEKGRKDMYNWYQGFAFALRWVLGEESLGEISPLLPESKIVRPKRKYRGKLRGDEQGKINTNGGLYRFFNFIKEKLGY